jgi:hypothetical protein
MNLDKQLNRLQNNLENFDLEVFFHDETFFEILEDRQKIEDNLEHLTKKQENKLHYIDNIIDSYYNLYKTKELKGYEKLSFKLLQDVDNIVISHLENVA